MPVDANQRWVPIKTTKKKDSEDFEVTWLLRENWRFQEPFFLQTVAKRAANGTQKVTGLDEVLRISAEESGIEPAGFIFHLSRCGSTAISQMLCRDPENLVLSEPVPIEGMLGLAKKSVPQRLALFIGATKAIARSASQNEKRLLIKFSGSDFWLPWIKIAYPKTPWIFVYREPDQVLRSNLEKPPHWLDHFPPEKRSEIALKKIEMQLSTALEHARDATLLVNYNEIDQSFPLRLQRAFRLPQNPLVLESMKESLLWYSKNEGHLWNDWQEAEKTKMASKQTAISANLKIPENILSLYWELERWRRKRSKVAALEHRDNGFADRF